MCYLGPTSAAIITTFIWKGRKTAGLFWLMLMFYGGALFGVIDHLWNGELFLVSEEWIKDLTLGLVITAGTILAWRVIILLAKRTPFLNDCLTSAEVR